MIAFISTMRVAIATYHNGMCIHPTNVSVTATCEGFAIGALNASLQDIVGNNSKHRLVGGQQESFGRGFYDGYAATWAAANITLPIHTINNDTQP